MQAAMGLGTWLKQNRLHRTEEKLKSLRSRLKHNRKKLEEVAKNRDKGEITADEAAARERKLHEERDKLTREINDLVAEEERLRKELAAADALPVR